MRIIVSVFVLTVTALVVLVISGCRTAEVWGCTCG